MINDKYHALMRLEIDRARRLFNSGRLAIPCLASDGSRLMAATVATLYERSLDHRLQANGHGSAGLSTWQRIRLLPAIWTAARTS
jgi:phytoene/squalene synthetase